MEEIEELKKKNNKKIHKNPSEKRMSENGFAKKIFKLKRKYSYIVSLLKRKYVFFLMLCSSKLKRKWIAPKWKRLK